MSALKPRRRLTALLTAFLATVILGSTTLHAQQRYRNKIEEMKARQAAAQEEAEAGEEGAASAAPAKTGKVPATKWYQQAKGYQKALAKQEETGADIVVYFARYGSKEKGLCKWFEGQKGLNSQALRKYLRDYIKVKVLLPGNPESQDLAEEMDVRKCPAFFVVQTNGWAQYCKLFEKKDGRLKLRETDDLINIIRNRSGDRYYDPDAE